MLYIKVSNEMLSKGTKNYQNLNQGPIWHQDDINQVLQNLRYSISCLKTIEKLITIGVNNRKEVNVIIHTFWAGK